MLLDQCQFSDAQALTGSSTENSTNVIDLENTTPNVGGGTPIWLYCRVNTTFASATSQTLIVALQNSTASGGTYVSRLISPTYTVGQLVKGFDMLTTPLPLDCIRYLKMLYTNAVGSGFTAGNVDAFLSLNAPYNP